MQVVLFSIIKTLKSKEITQLSTFAKMSKLRIKSLVEVFWQFVCLVCVWFAVDLPMTKLTQVVY